MSEGGISNGLGEAAANNGATSELNNLLQIIGGTTALLENIWTGTAGSERYLSMLRSSVERAARVTALIVEKAGGAAVQDRPALAASSSGTDTNESSEHKPTLVPPARRRIMLVDDEPMTLMLFEKLLEADGYEVITAESGFQALDFLSRDRDCVDLVVLDYTMPFMDGEETLQRLRSISPTLPVILATGFIHQKVLNRMFAANLSRFVQKPLPPNELLLHIAEVLAATKA